jgi:hypothetical protein
VGGGIIIAGEAAAGAAAVRARTALVAGDVDGVRVALPEMDEAHRVEVLLGAALRDSRDGFGGLGRWREARARPLQDPAWHALVGWLVAAEPQDALDVLAAGVLLRPDGAGALRGRPEAPPQDLARMDATVRWLRAGGDARSWLVHRDADVHAQAVADYLGWTDDGPRIRALGLRPLLVYGALRGPPEGA